MKMLRGAAIYSHARQDFLFSYDCSLLPSRSPNVFHRISSLIRRFPDLLALGCCEDPTVLTQYCHGLSLGFPVNIPSQRCSGEAPTARRIRTFGFWYGSFRLSKQIEDSARIQVESRIDQPVAAASLKSSSPTVIQQVLNVWCGLLLPLRQATVPFLRRFACSNTIVDPTRQTSFQCH